MGKGLRMQRPDITKPFGVSVKAWRRRLGISQEELGDRAGLHRTYVCDIERGARNVSLESIDKLAAALQISVAKLFSYEPSSGVPEKQTVTYEDLVDILFVEDNPHDVEITTEALKGISNRVHVARDGREALDFLFCEGPYATRRPAQRPQLILLDLALPIVDGLEVLRRVKADSRTAKIPVVILTSSDRDRDLQISRRLGAQAYIIKPVGVPNLTRVAPMLSLRWALLKPSPTATL
jgi:two-component system, response regulator